MNYLYEKAIGKFNWSCINVNNIYNLLINIMEDMNEHEQKKILDKIKMYVGISFYNDYKMYCCRKGILISRIFL